MIPPVWIAFTVAQAAQREKQKYTWKSTPATLKSIELTKKLRQPPAVCAKCGLAYERSRAVGRIDSPNSRALALRFIYG
jgi:hypothetical protein